MSAQRSRNWRAVLTAPWLASHLFAATLIVGFVLAGLWQLDRLSQRRAENELIAARASEEPISLAQALDRPAEELAYVRLADQGRYLDDEVIRVANRSQNGLGGDWVVGLFETESGHLLLVNRGFAGREEEAGPAVDGPIEGWLQDSQTKDGFFGATDSGEGLRVPRLDVDAIAARLELDQPLAPAWLQLDDPGASGIPAPVPLPAIDERNHFSYAMQWFTFAALSVLVYGLLLRKQSSEHPRHDDEISDVLV